MKQVFVKIEIADDEAVPPVGYPLDVVGELDGVDLHYAGRTVEPQLTLSTGELELLAEALDSHVYWQLSDEERRDSGFVYEPYSEEEQDALALEDKVRAFIRGRCPECGHVHDHEWTLCHNCGWDSAR